MDLSPLSTWIVIPAYNETQSLCSVLDRLIPLGCQIVVVDDGSCDDTFESIQNQPVFRLRHAINLGQGAALQTGITYALQQGAQQIVTFDADGQHRAEDIPSLLAPVLAGQCDVALGTRFRSEEARKAIPPVRRFVLKLATSFTRITTGLPLSDTHNGIRAFNRNAAKKIHLTQNRMSHASEILQQIAQARLRVQEVEVKILYSQYSLSKGQHLTNAINILFDLLHGKIH